MKAKGRYERYHINQNKDTLFKIVDKNNQSAITSLWVCMPCLQQLNYKDCNRGRNTKYIVRNQFDFQEFLQTYTTNFNELPIYVGQDKGGYTNDWVNISTLYRASKNYICEKCGVNLSSRKGLLHTHHKNGVTHDNSFNNLQALCIVCHGDEPFHRHISNMIARAKADILVLRQTQGIIYNA